MPISTPERVFDNRPAANIVVASIKAIEIPVFNPPTDIMGQVSRYFSRQDTGHQLSLPTEQNYAFYPNWLTFVPAPVEPEITELANRHSLAPDTFRDYLIFKKDQPAGRLSLMTTSLRAAALVEHHQRSSSQLNQAQIEAKTQEKLRRLWINRPGSSYRVPTEVIKIENSTLRPEHLFVHHLQAAVSTH